MQSHSSHEGNGPRKLLHSHRNVSLAPAPGPRLLMCVSRSQHFYIEQRPSRYFHITLLIKHQVLLFARLRLLKVFTVPPLRRSALLAQRGQLTHTETKQRQRLELANS